MPWQVEPPPPSSPPNIGDLLWYLGDGAFVTNGVLTNVLAAEMAAQARRCRMPAQGEQWPADLVEALMRRCASNIANRALPLGVSSSVAEAAVQTVRVGGLDREVRRLEAPYRKVVLG